MTESSDIQFEDLGDGSTEDNKTGTGTESGLEAVYDVPVRVKAVLGERDIHINELLKLGRGALVVLNRKVGDAIDIYVNDRLVARGEVVIHEDKLGVTMTEIVKSQH